MRRSRNHLKPMLTSLLLFGATLLATWLIFTFLEESAELLGWLSHTFCSKGTTLHCTTRQFQKLDLYQTKTQRNTGHSQNLRLGGILPSHYPGSSHTSFVRNYGMH